MATNKQSRIVGSEDDAGSRRRTEVLTAAIEVIGRLGIKKASVEDIAVAAGLSKQGLYLHFSSKEEIVTAAIRRYFDDGMCLVEQALAGPDAALHARLVDALDAWFGRHLVHFNPATLNLLSSATAHPEVEQTKDRVRALLAHAIERAPEYRDRKNVCTPSELAIVLFQFGLTWKEGHASREAFRRTLELQVRACLQVSPSPRVTGKARKTAKTGKARSA
jgi:AcrR family transcriptional regulator